MMQQWQSDNLYASKTKEIIRRLVNRFGKGQIHQINNLVATVPRQVILTKPLDHIEAELHQKFGHWS